MNDYKILIEELDKFQKEVHKLAVLKGWWRDDRSDGELIALIHSEISECLEAIRRHNPPDDKVPQHNNAVVELADCLIRILDYCDGRGWNFSEALVDKHEYNKTREYKHGGKKF